VKTRLTGGFGLAEQHSGLTNLPKMSVKELYTTEKGGTQETAVALSLSENNVKTRLLRARLRLRQELSVYFSGKMP